MDNKQTPKELNEDTLDTVSGGANTLDNDFIKDEVMLIIPIV